MKVPKKQARWKPELESLEIRVVPTTYQVVDIGPDIDPVGINALNQVIGYNNVLYSDGKTTIIGPVIGGGISALNGINDAGAIIGQTRGSTDGTRPSVGFLYFDGSLTFFGNQFIPLGINNLGQMVGGNELMDSAGNVTTIGDTGLAAINDAGQIAGVEVDANFQFHAFLRSVDGTLTFLGSLADAQITQSIRTQCRWRCRWLFRRSRLLVLWWRDDRHRHPTGRCKKHSR